MNARRTVGLCAIVASILANACSEEELALNPEHRASGAGGTSSAGGPPSSGGAHGEAAGTGGIGADARGGTSSTGDGDSVAGQSMGAM